LLKLKNHGEKKMLNQINYLTLISIKPCSEYPLLDISRNLHQHNNGIEPHKNLGASSETYKLGKTKLVFQKDAREENTCTKTNCPYHYRLHPPH